MPASAAFPLRRAVRKAVTYTPDPTRTRVAKARAITRRHLRRIKVQAWTAR